MRIGGMHHLMAFIASIGKLYKDGGLMSMLTDLDVYALATACQMAQDQYGISTELIDLRTILPWDVHSIEQSVKKTGKLIVSHDGYFSCRYGFQREYIWVRKSNVWSPITM